MPSITQRQVNTEYHSDDNSERCLCPFCSNLTVGIYKLENDNWYLEKKEACHHFVDFIQGYNSPTAMFKGVIY